MLLALPLCVAARSGTPPGAVSFDRLGARDGLSSGHVSAILQDRAGFLWVGTADGLNRYDGYGITVFRHDPLDPTSIRGNWISGLSLDGAGNLWIALGIGGADRFDPDRQVFEHYTAIDGDSAAARTPLLTAFIVDGAGRTRIGTNQGLSHLVDAGGHPAFIRDSLTIVRSGPGTPQVTALAADGSALWVGTAAHGLFREPFRPGQPALPEPGVRSLLVDRSSRLWVGADRNLYRLDPDRNTFLAQLGPDTGGHPVSRLLEDGDGGIWAVVGAGAVAHLAPGDSAFRRLPLPAHVLASGGGLVRRIFCDAEGRVWLATGAGLVIWDAAANALHAYGHDPADPASLPHNVVSALFEDRAGTLWVGTWGGGLAKLNERSMRFHRHHNPFADPSIPSASSIGAILVDRRDRLWLGTASGLYGVDARGDGEPVSVDAEIGHPVVAAAVLALHEDADGRLWIGHQLGLTLRTDGGGEHGTYRRIDSPLFDGIGVNVIRVDRRGGMWLGTTQGLVHLDADGHAFRYPVAPGDPNALPAGHVSALHQDDDGTLWVGTYVGGLSRLDPETDTFVHFLPGDGGPGAESAINSLSVTDIAEDHAGRLWVGTYSGGLNLLDRETGRFTHVTSSDGLVGTRIAGILEDEVGHLWLSSNEGICRFDPETRAVRAYDVADGLQADEFHVGSRYRASDGTLFFAGVDGFNAFHPEEIVDNLVPPKVAITAFRLMDRPARMADHRGRDHDILLSHDERFIAFEFAALDFTNPKKNRYAYRLEGVDAGWVDAGTRRYAAYTNLDPGQYVFRVKGSNNDGVWNEAGVALSIRIVPPFWRTRWFTALASVVLVGLALAAHRAAIRRRVAGSLAMERVRVAERERVREELSRDYHDELGARLTKISLFTELIRRHMAGRDTVSAGAAIGERREQRPPESATPEPRDDVATYVEKVAHSAEVLARESRDFIWALDPSKDALLDLAHHLQELGAGLFDRTDVMFRVEGLTTTLGDVRLDTRRKRQITLIFTEAMTNVLKHARAAHAVLTFGTEQGEIVITLTDDGRGIDAAGVASSSAGAASGMGLSNMSARARAIDGALAVARGPAGGTIVALRVPRPEEV